MALCAVEPLAAWTELQRVEYTDMWSGLTAWRADCDLGVEDVFACGESAEVFAGWRWVRGEQLG